MTMRWLGLALFFSSAVAAASCSSSDGGSTQPLGGGPGAPCTKDAQCTGYSIAACITDLKPVANLVTPDSGVAGETFGKLDVPFPGGYCANQLDDACKSDADCGSGGCFRPFEGVSQATLMALDNLVKVFSVSRFADIGLCMKPCDADSDCRTDEHYKCVVPLHDLINVVNPDYQTKFCVQDVDTKYILAATAPDGG